MINEHRQGREQDLTNRLTTLKQKLRTKDLFANAALTGAGAIITPLFGGASAVGAWTFMNGIHDSNPVIVTGAVELGIVGVLAGVASLVSAGLTVLAGVDTASYAITKARIVNTERKINKLRRNAN